MPEHLVITGDPCTICGGRGTVVASHPLTLPVQVRCASCVGTGRALVPLETFLEPLWAEVRRLKEQGAPKRWQGWDREEERRREALRKHGTLNPP